MHLDDQDNGHPALAQVMISWFMSSRPTLGSLLSVQSQLRILSLPLTLPLPHLHTRVHVLSLSLKSKHLKKE